MSTMFCTVLTVVTALLVSVPAQAQDNRKEIELHYKQAQEALRAGKSDIAVREFQEILRLQPSNAQAHANLGVIAFTGGDYTHASQEFRAALKLEPALWNATAFLGMSERHLGHPAEALKLLGDSFSHLDKDLQRQAGMDLISIYYDSGELNKAVDVLRTLQSAKSDGPDVLYAAYRTYSDLAAKALASLAEAAPESAPMHQILAQNLASRDEFQGAIGEYRRAIALDPRLPGLHYELAQMILANSTEQGARSEAEQEFRRELVLNPTSAESEYMLGVLAWLQSKPEDALQHCLNALRLRPDLVDAHIAAGKALRALHRAGEAVGELETAVRLYPRNEVAHYRLAQEYQEIGRHDDAARESAIFHQLRDAQQPIRTLYQNILERPGMHETIESGAEKP
jgi:tetratricopeptide (TPR) repeat protein